MRSTLAPEGWPPSCEPPPIASLPGPQATSPPCRCTSVVSRLRLCTYSRHDPHLRDISHASWRMWMACAPSMTMCEWVHKPSVKYGLTSSRTTACYVTPRAT
eukprot:6466798-Prymnesium_polylepis.2